MRTWQSKGASQIICRLCSNSKTLNQCKQVHQRLIQHGLHQSPFIITKLLQIYADTDDLVSARKLFDEMLQPNIFAWTAIIGYFSRHGLARDCVRTYGEMKFVGVRPDNYVIPKVLRACAHLSSWEVGALVHKDAIACGFELNLLVCRALIDMYGKCGDIESGRKVFDEMGERDLLSWNSMISGFVCNGLVDAAVEIFRKMRSEGVEPDIVTFNMVIDAYCRMGHCDEAKRLFEVIEEPNIISWTTLISGYSRVGEHKTSLDVFSDMVSRGKVCPDVDCLSSALASCRHLGAFTNGREIHGYGVKRLSCLGFYSSAGAALLTMYTTCGRIRAAKNVFELMDRNDVVTWNAMIFGFTDLGLENLAIEHFLKMQRMGIASDETTISTILPICDLKFGVQIHAHFLKSSSHSCVAIWNALIYMYSKCGCIESAYAIFSNLVIKDLVSWNAMIGGFGMHGRAEEALKLLQEMKHSGLQPNFVTFTSALSACSHSGLVDEGLELFSLMVKDFRFTPKMEQFACMVDMLARAGRFEDAVSFIRRMPIEPDKRIWGAVLAACRAHQNIDVACIAAEELIRLEPRDAGHYVTLANIYARAGRWEDAVRVRKLMEGQVLNKPLGYSLIECEAKGVQYMN